MSWRNVPIRYVIALALAGIIAGISVFNAHTVDNGITELWGELAGQSAKNAAEQLRNDIERAIQGRAEDLEKIRRIIDSANASGADALLISNSGEIVAGPRDTNLLPVAVEKALAAAKNVSAYILASGSTETLAVGYARTRVTHPPSPAGLTVVVRHPASAVPEPLTKLQNRIWPWAIFFSFHGAVIAWFAANLIASPLMRLATAADAIRKGKATGNLPEERAYFEVDRLSLSLQSLIENLRAKERMQAELAVSLEAQVMERTAHLRERNLSLERVNACAEEAVQSRSRFLAAASHDLRQPLQALNLVARRLSRRITSGEDGGLVAKVEQSVTSLSHMFNALLDMTRLDSGIIQARETPIALREFLEAIAADFKAQCQLRGLEFRFRCPDLHVLADPVILETIVRNLLSNAEKFTARGSILLAARKRGDAVMVSVHDTGAGIAPERLSLVFKEFERSPRQADGPNQGLGLGLSIAGRYAKLIGAGLSLRSILGRGSCFALIVPCFNNAGRTSGALPAKEGLDYWNQKRVLLLDDDTRVLDALNHELSDHGAEVAAFTSPESARVGLLAGMTFDVAITDYDLSGPENGAQFLDRLQLLHPTPLASLILTGRTDPQTVNAIASSGWSWFIKPVDSRTITEHLARHGHIAAAKD